MIRLRSVSKSYAASAGRHWILRDVDLDIPSGVSLAILGRNGAGKSTLLRMIGGIEPPDKGAITSDGRISWPVGLAGAAQGSLTGRQNAKFVCRIHGCAPDETREKVSFVESFSDLGSYFNMPVKSYSSGMKGRLGFALSMAFDHFDYYLIDEITAVGDRHFRQKCEETFEERRLRCKVLMVSHDMGTLKRLCDAAILVGNGGISYFDNVQAAIDVYTST
jgi:capsular polysaccharide transport system ATP-binding protein